LALRFEKGTPYTLTTYIILDIISVVKQILQFCATFHR